MRRAWLLLVFTAALALWLWRSPRSEAPDSTAGGGGQTAEPGYEATGAVMFDTDADGQPQYRLTASRVEQPNPATDIELTAPEIHYQGDSDWMLSAQHGVLPATAQQVTLTGDVLVTAQRPRQATLRIRTDSLSVDMLQQRLDTSAAIAMDWGPNRLWATGLHADMKADSLRLESHAHGEFTRR